jgi:hypothetical protein
MKISEYIKKLQVIEDVEGDLEAVIPTMDGLEGIPAVRIIAAARDPIVEELLVQKGDESSDKLTPIPGKRIAEEKQQNFYVAAKCVRIA